MWGVNGPLTSCYLERNKCSSWLGVWGDAGIADGRDGTQQGKSVKRSLGNEPAAAPVLIMGKKKVHGNSDPDQPGKALDFGKSLGK